MTHRGKGLSVVGVLAIAATVASTGFATGKQRTTPPPCPTHTLCVFSDNPFGETQRVKIRGEGISNKLAQVMNNDAEAVYNRRSKVSILFAGRNGNGTSFCVGPNAAYADLGAFNNTASSTKLTKNRTSCPP